MAVEAAAAVGGQWGLPRMRADNAGVRPNARSGCCTSFVRATVYQESERLAAWRNAKFAEFAHVHRHVHSASRATQSSANTLLVKRFGA